ncbi:hypothetical protein KAR91_29270 [Candidatus Pacearchaeota archaeon]|nr:hypothetical protein [Candidatus Pacearchaeota archaeon]
MSEQNIKFADEIMQIRLVKKETITQFAKRIGVTEKEQINIENGSNPSVLYMQKLIYSNTDLSTSFYNSQGYKVLDTSIKLSSSFPYDTGFLVVKAQKIIRKTQAYLDSLPKVNFYTDVEIWAEIEVFESANSVDFLEIFYDQGIRETIMIFRKRR